MKTKVELTIELSETIKMIKQNCEFTLSIDFRGDVWDQIQFTINRCNEALDTLNSINTLNRP